MPRRSRVNSQTTAPQFGEVFVHLKAILEPYAAYGLRVDADGPERYSLSAPPSPQVPQYKQGLPFGAIRRGKAYVSYHLMPLYACPDLLDGMSPALKRRMQGKSCFNFSSPTTVASVADELASLTARGLAAYRDRGFI